MRNLVMLLAALVVIGCLSFAVAGPDNERNGETVEKEIAELKSANLELKRQVAVLEERLGRLEVLQNRSKDVPVESEKGSTPKSWQRREFNGQPYYIVPLLDGAKVEVKTDDITPHGLGWTKRSQ